MSEKSAWFVTGTDTDIGKTFVACALLRVAQARGLVAVGMKPVAAGAEQIGNEWVNDDVARLRAAGSFDPGLADLNPYCFRSAIAPHIAAADEGIRIVPGRITAALGRLRARADVVIVEGAGGFLVPLDERYDTADLAAALALPVILVVGMRLGCLNHALLTAQAVTARGLPLAGWVANRIDPLTLRFEENLAALRSRIPAPLLGVVPHGASDAVLPGLELPEQ